MPVDIGTGTIGIEIDQRQVRAEAMQASRTLARTPTELRPSIDSQQLAGRLRQSIAAAGGRNTWRPFELGGLAAMNAVGARGVASMQAIETRGVTAAARVQAAFRNIRMPGGAPGVAGGGGFGGGAARAVSAAPRAAGAGRLGQQSINLAATASLASNIGPVGDAINTATQAAMSAGPYAALIAAAAVAVGAVYSRFQRFGGFREGAPGGALLEAIGFRRAGRISGESRIAQQVGGVAQLTGATGDLARARLRAARQAEESATQEQRSRGEYARSRRETIQARQDEVRDLRRRLRATRSQRFQADIARRFGLGSGLQGVLARSGLVSWFGRNFREPDLRFGIGQNREQLQRARTQLREEEFGTGVSGRLRQLLRIRRDDGEVAAPRGRDLERQREQLRILNEQQIDAVADQADEYRRGTDLLRRRISRDRTLAADERNQRRRYIRALRARAVAERAASIRESSITQGLGVTARTAFGRSGLGLGQRVTALATGLATFGSQVAAAATAFVVLGVAVYALAAATRRFEQQQAAQIAAQSIARRRVQGGDVEPIAAGIRAGAAGGLSELEVYRTSIAAIRTGSRDIFENTEQVLGDLRVVAAATGVAFEDATQRFFSGIIKREQELLDELGIVARVEAANARYARSLNIAASELTPYQQQLAFAAEVQRQLTISAEDFGREGVLSTQNATTAVGELRAAWGNFVSTIGETGQGIIEIGADFGAATLRGATAIAEAANRTRLIEERRRRRRRGTGAVADNAEFLEINRLERARNMEIEGRLALLTKASLAGALDIRQQRSLLALNRDIARQQADIFGPGGIGAPSPDFELGNIDAAISRLAEFRAVLDNLRERRGQQRIAEIQGPLNALLSSLEGGGRIARLSAEAYEDLTRGTAESEEAIRNLAFVYGRSVPEVRALIGEYRTLDAVQKENRDTLLGLRNALNFGPLLREELDAVAAGLNAGILQFRNLNESLGEFGSARAEESVRIFEDIIPGAESAANVVDFSEAAQRREAREFMARREASLAADFSLTGDERFAASAAQLGLTLDTMQTNLANFVEGITLEGENLQQALGNFLRDIARTVVQGASRNVGQSILGGLFTNIVPGQRESGGSGLSLQDVNEASQRQGAYTRVNEFYEAVG